MIVIVIVIVIVIDCRATTIINVSPAIAPTIILSFDVLILIAI